MSDLQKYTPNISADDRPIMSIYVGFKHCDPAGIVFYPKYVEMLNDVVEQWFKDGIGVDFAQLHIDRHASMPVVSLDCQFQKTSTLSETIDAYLAVNALGRSSVKLTITVTKGGDKNEVRFYSQLTLVCMDLRSKKAMSLPTDIRSGMEKFLAST